MGVGVKDTRCRYPEERETEADAARRKSREDGGRSNHFVIISSYPSYIQYLDLS